VEQTLAEQRLQAAMPQLVNLVASGFASTIQAVSTSHLAINDVKTELGAVAMVMADVISGRAQLATTTRIEAQWPSAGAFDPLFIHPVDD